MNNPIKAGYFHQSVEGVVCDLCPHRCALRNGARGLCGARAEQDRALWSLGYGHLISSALDPIEKKPLFHFLPGTRTLSIAGAGCNLRCMFCQNHSISTAVPEDFPGDFIPPELLVSHARAADVTTLAFTYTEPTLNIEYIIEAAGLARAQGLRTILVTNGYINPNPLSDLLAVVDALNIDLKCFSERSYREIMRGSLEPVLDSIRLVAASGVWLEVTTLVVPGLNDSSAELEQIASFLVGLGASIPWHISRFHPMHRMDRLPPTPVQVIRDAVSLGRAAGLAYVYPGNLGQDPTETSCTSCGEGLILRRGYQRPVVRLVEGRCPSCGHETPGVWK